MQHMPPLLNCRTYHRQLGSKHLLIDTNALLLQDAFVMVEEYLTSFDPKLYLLKVHRFRDQLLGLEQPVNLGQPSWWRWSLTSCLSLRHPFHLGSCLLVKDNSYLVPGLLVLNIAHCVNHFHLLCHAWLGNDGLREIVCLVHLVILGLEP